MAKGHKLSLVSLAMRAERTEGEALTMERALVTYQRVATEARDRAKAAWAELHAAAKEDQDE